MKLIRQDEYLKDTRMLALVRSQGKFGADTAKSYAELIEKRSWRAFEQFRFDDAIELAERGFVFCGRALGLSHQYSRVAKQYLIALRMAVRAAQTGTSLDCRIAG